MGKFTNSITLLKSQIHLKSFKYFFFLFVFLQISVSVKAQTDSDGDTIPDITDLDDDNDGILDSVECPPRLPDTNIAPSQDGILDNTFFPTNYWAVSYYEGVQGGGVAPNDWDPRNGTAGPGTAVYRGETFLGLNQDILDYAANGTSAIGPNAWTQFETPTDPIAPPNYVGTTWAGTGNPHYQIEFRRRAPLNGTISVGGTPNTYFDDTVEIEINGVLVYYAAPAGGPSGKPSLTNIVSFTVNQGDEMLIRFQNAGFIGGASFRANFIPEIIDTDGDGLADCFDLDSDGDGCPDALEGDGTFVTGDLVDASGTMLQGGNSGMGYIGTSMVAVTDNLGTTSDTVNMATLGVPLTGLPATATTQGIGQSQNGGDTSACPIDTDGDTIPDNVDVDDDNDGILDTVEGFCGPSPLVISFETDNENWVEDNNNNGSLGSLLDHSTDASTGIGSCTIPRIPRPSGNFILREDCCAGGMYFESPNNLNIDVSSAIDGAFSFYWINENFNGTGTQNTNDLRINLVGGGTSVFTDISVVGLSNTGWQLLSVPLSDASWSGTLINLQTVLGDLDRIEIRVETIQSLDFGAGSTNCTNAEWFGLDEIRFDCLSTDTDGDGIPNQLDLDSDGDGCPDAVEGDGSPMLADLVAATGTPLNIAFNNNNDGSIASGYTGTTTQSVIDNLGNTVDTSPTSPTYGSPITGTPAAGITQGIGGSEDVNDTSGCCEIVPPTIGP